MLYDMYLLNLPTYSVWLGLYFHKELNLVSLWKTPIIFPQINYYIYNGKRNHKILYNVESKIWPNTLCCQLDAAYENPKSSNLIPNGLLVWIFVFPSCVSFAQNAFYPILCLTQSHHASQSNSNVNSSLKAFSRLPQEELIIPFLCPCEGHQWLHFWQIQCIFSVYSLFDLFC